MNKQLNTEARIELAQLLLAISRLSEAESKWFRDKILTMDPKLAIALFARIDDMHYHLRLRLNQLGRTE